MDNQFDKLQGSSSETGEMKTLRENLKIAEQQGNEGEVLRLENEIRVIESGQVAAEKGTEQVEAVSEIQQETIATQEQLPQKEKLAEEILANVEELGANIEKKDPKFYSEKAMVLLGRLGQIAAGGVGVVAVASAGLHGYEAIQTLIEMDGPTSVLTGKPLIGAVELTAKGEIYHTYYAIMVYSLAIGAVMGAAGLLIEEKIDKIKSKMQLIKNKFQTA